MKTSKNRVKIFIYSLLATIFIMSVSLAYFESLKVKKEQLQYEKFTKEAATIKKEVENFLVIKKKSTLTLAIALAQDNSLKEEIKKGEINHRKYLKMLESFRKNTDYKNIWIQVIDKDLRSLYRSWTKNRGDSLRGVRSDLEHIFQTKENFTAVSVGKYDLSIKAISPIYDGDELLGVIEIISHFNSIGWYLEQLNIEPLFVLHKHYKKQLLYPMTQKFIQNEYYIANFNASDDKVEYLNSHGVENYFHDGYKVENDYLIVSVPIKDINNAVLAYAVMFKKTSLIDKNDTRFFMLKYIGLFIFILLMVAIVLVLALFISNKKQKAYYQDIIDSTTDMILVNNGTRIQYANEMFFKYFNQVDNIEEFFQEYGCICELFYEEEGYLQKYMDGLLWIDYLLLHTQQNNKVKLSINGSVLTFSIKASYLKERESGAVVVLSDITTNERLLNISLTDELTQIGNRRQFNHDIVTEISLANRHQQHFSLIMFDIDFFKKVNDEYGHDVGDAVLQECTQLISVILRKEDRFFRVGGEEFMVLLPSTRLESAIKIAEKLRLHTKKHSKVVSITISLGVSEYIFGETKESLLKRVDVALYNAKENGRDRVGVVE